MKGQNHFEKCLETIKEILGPKSNL